MGIEAFKHSLLMAEEYYLCITYIYYNALLLSIFITY